MESKELIGCCGIYCGNCARWKDYTAFRNAAKVLLEIADAHHFQHWMPEDVKEFDYKEFRKGLQFFADDDSWLVCKKPCKDNESMVHCRLRQCCEEHNVANCYECHCFPCEDLKAWSGRFNDYIEDYKELGREKWLQQCEKRAKEGYELHTRKCYSVLLEPAAGDGGGSDAGKVVGD